MHEAGRGVPESVSVVGFDDTPLAPFYHPALTTIRQDFRALGQVSFAKLRAALGRSPAPDELVVPRAELVIRESAGPAPAPRRRGTGESAALLPSAATGGRNGGRPLRARAPRPPAPAAAAPLRVTPEQTQPSNERSTTVNVQDS
jgi:hypothetical protein